MHTEEVKYHMDYMLDIRKLHFIGIGGISMSSLAALSHKKGFIVTGSDRSESAITVRLREMGIEVYIGHDPSHINDCDAVVYTAAIAAGNAELEAARKKGIPSMTRAVYMGRFMRDYKSRIGIAGTHGKSTVTSMTAGIMMAAGLNPTVISGAEFIGLKGEGQASAAYHSGGADSLIFEACEYTDSFLSFFPTTAVVTNVELDHMDYFHSLEQYIKSFTAYINIAGTAVINFDSVNARRAAEGFNGSLIGFSINAGDAQYRACDIVYDGGMANFDLIHDGEYVCSISLSVAGEYNVYNALAAAAASLENGAAPQAVKSGLGAFTGAMRRFELKGKQNGVTYYDDYAHHPTEIKSTLSAARTIAGKRRIICIFQPHSLSRTAELFDGFTAAFDDADITVFTDIYENLEHDSGNVSATSASLSEKVHNALYMSDFTDIASYIRKEARDGDIVITMGAGNIYKIYDMFLKF